jgi:putative ATP-dependent endonuclease of OLD family
VIPPLERRNPDPSAFITIEPRSTNPGSRRFVAEPPRSSGWGHRSTTNIMRLERVHIQNYRSIKEADFRPSELCALIGGNNCGKSNVLKAIDLVLGDRWPGVRSLEDKDFHGYDESREICISLWFNEERTVRGDVGDPVPYSGIQFRVSRYKRSSGKHRKGDLKTEFHCIDNSGAPVEVLKRPPGRSTGQPHKQPARVTEEIRSALPVVMVDVDRNARHHLSGSQWSILGRMLLVVSKSLKGDVERFQRFQQKFEEARQLLRTSEFEQLQTQIVKNLEAHTGIAGVDITLDEIDPINLYKSFSVLFKDPETPQPVDADRMGSGIQSAVVISLLQAYRELHKEDAILLFEEPELFLHPHGRRHLYRLLCELSHKGTQVIYTTHSQDFVDLSRLDGVRLVTKTALDGTVVKAPVKSPNVPLSADWKQRLKQIRQFSSPRNEVFFADSVVLVEGTTEVGAISVLADLMPTPIEFDRHNCSVIEVGGKENLPMFIKMVHALGKRVFVIYDTDSDKTDPQDIATNQRRNEAIAEALAGNGELSACDPYFEEVAGISGSSKKDKEAKVREHLSTFKTWADVPNDLCGLMERIAALVTSAPASSCPVES